MAEKETKKKVKVRVLTQCCHGKPNDVVAIDEGLIEGLEAGGVVDSDAAAVAYAEKNQPKKSEADDVIE